MVPVKQLMDRCNPDLAKPCANLDVAALRGQSFIYRSARAGDKPEEVGKVSTISWSTVCVWMVVIRHYSVPKSPWTPVATRARQLLVQVALDVETVVRWQWLCALIPPYRSEDQLVWAEPGQRHSVDAQVPVLLGCYAVQSIAHEGLPKFPEGYVAGRIAALEHAGVVAVRGERFAASTRMEEGIVDRMRGPLVGLQGHSWDKSAEHSVGKDEVMGSIPVARAPAGGQRGQTVNLPVQLPYSPMPIPVGVSEHSGEQPICNQLVRVSSPVAGPLTDGQGEQTLILSLRVSCESLPAPLGPPDQSEEMPTINQLVTGSSLLSMLRRVCRTYEEEENLAFQAEGRGFEPRCIGPTNPRYRTGAFRAEDRWNLQRATCPLVSWQYCFYLSVESDGGNSTMPAALGCVGLGSLAKCEMGYIKFKNDYIILKVNDTIAPRNGNVAWVVIPNGGHERWSSHTKRQQITQEFIMCRAVYTGVLLWERKSESLVIERDCILKLFVVAAALERACERRYGRSHRPSDDCFRVGSIAAPRTTPADRPDRRRWVKRDQLGSIGPSMSRGPFLMQDTFLARLIKARAGRSLSRNGPAMADRVELCVKVPRGDATTCGSLWIIVDQERARRPQCVIRGENLVRSPGPDELKFVRSARTGEESPQGSGNFNSGWGSSTVPRQNEAGSGFA